MEVGVHWHWPGSSRCDAHFLNFLGLFFTGSGWLLLLWASPLCGAPPGAGRTEHLSSFYQESRRLPGTSLFIFQETESRPGSLAARQPGRLALQCAAHTGTPTWKEGCGGATELLLSPIEVGGGERSSEVVVGSAASSVYGIYFGRRVKTSFFSWAHFVESTSTASPRGWHLFPPVAASPSGSRMSAWCTVFSVRSGCSLLSSGDLQLVERTCPPSTFCKLLWMKERKCNKSSHLEKERIRKL